MPPAAMQQSIRNNEGRSRILYKVSPTFAGKKYAIPPPTFCPDCRQQRRLSWRNDGRSTRDKAICAKSRIVSMYATDSPFQCTAMHVGGGQRDAAAFARDFDFGRQFYEQYLELRNTVPRMLSISKTGRTASTCITLSMSKTVIWVCASAWIGGCYYSRRWYWNSKNMGDCYQMMIRVVLWGCYSDHNFRCHNLWLSNQCSESAFSVRCTACSHCFQLLESATQGVLLRE